MKPSFLDDQQRFVIRDYAHKRPFSSFLPSIAGPLGIPLWVFYVNRGQGICSFGVENKDNPIVEFQPANKAYQLTPLTGFRTFLRSADGQIYEPFAPWSDGAERSMACGANDLALAETCPALRLATRVLYFTLPGEPFAALARRVELTNAGSRPLELEVLDGLPAVTPYGVNNWVLKEINRTLEAWMEVYNLAESLPFYHLRASVVDSAEVATIEAGHFALGSLNQGGAFQRLPALVDPEVVFGQNSSLQSPDGFRSGGLDGLLNRTQIVCGKTPCAFFGAKISIAPGETVAFESLYGHAASLDGARAAAARIAIPGYLQAKHAEASALAEQITAPIETRSADALFDAYCRQSYLDNVLRGGQPVLLPGAQKPHVFHLYSRKHGDLERDYNAFQLSAEFYTQGNGAFRDVNQNRRDDVRFLPAVGDFNIRVFYSLIQPDGYNPLLIKGSRFSLSAAQVDALAAGSAELKNFLSKPFSPGGLYKILLKMSSDPAERFARILAQAEQQVEASFGEGYWTDHWTYNLDLVESYLAVFPEKKTELLSGRADLPFYDSPAGVQPRERRAVLVNGQARQYHALHEDEEKAAHLKEHGELSPWVRARDGQIYTATLAAKMALLALLKFSALDPEGMGVEMEGGKPGWYDALNGLPGLFGSSLCESYELLRLVRFLRAAVADGSCACVRLPVEAAALLRSTLSHLKYWQGSSAPDRERIFWDQRNQARESYRAAVRDGFDGAEQMISAAELDTTLAQFEEKILDGLRRARELKGGVIPTYLRFESLETEPVRDAQGNPLADDKGRPFVRVTRFAPHALPPFLEGFVHALKTAPDHIAALEIYRQVRESALYDRKLKMYRVNAPLAAESFEIGRARAFTPGWLENESIWLHMEYKYLLELLRAGLVDEFYADLRSTLIPFLDPEVYGRSTLENSSFLVSSAHPDSALHGGGFVARLSGATAEFLSIWQHMTAGPNPFRVEAGGLRLALEPHLPGWLFDEESCFRFIFLGRCRVTLHNPLRVDTDKAGPLRRMALRLRDGRVEEIAGGTLDEPLALAVRDGDVDSIDLWY